MMDLLKSPHFRSALHRTRRAVATIVVAAVAMVLSGQAMAQPYAEPRLDAGRVKILIVTGGHGFEPSEFFAAFNAMPGIDYQHVMLDKGKPVAGPAGGLGQYDVILFYDMTVDPEAMTPEWRSLLDRGRGLVFLHHAVGSFPRSPEIKEIIGGHGSFTGPYPGLPQSSVAFGEKQHFTIIDRQHPVTCGMGDFDMIDEAYDNIDIDPAAHVLMTSSYPQKSPATAWTWQYDQKRVVYIRPGHGSLWLPLDHGPTAYQNASFTRLLSRAIFWTSGRL